jgi:hypothetical protein
MSMMEDMYAKKKEKKKKEKRKNKKEKEKEQKTRTLDGSEEYLSTNILIS